MAIGEGVTAWKAGDQVCALINGGGYAEYCTAPAEQCLPVPEGLSPLEAASLPETFFTVWSNVFDRARLALNEAEAASAHSRSAVSAEMLAAALAGEPAPENPGRTVMAAKAGRGSVGTCHVESLP